LQYLISSPGAFTRRDILKAAAAGTAAAALPGLAMAQMPSVINDASRLSPTQVLRHIVVRDDPDARLIEILRRELDTARRERRTVSMGCARHSMGGQSLHPMSSALTFESALCEPDADTSTFLARGGSRWRDVIAVLDPAGFSPAVMQSNNDFGIAGTLSVNAHGWPAPYGPFGTTVRSFRLMLADGTVLTCSRAENADLFGLVTGGYGLFGILIDVVAEMAPNVLLEPAFETMSADAFGTRFAAAMAEGADIRMAYGRLAVHEGRFLDEALMITYRPVPEPELPPAESGGFIAGISRRIFRAQVDRDWVKRVRWFTESVAGPAVLSGRATRNTLLNEPVANLAGGDDKRTDILHEYFLPPERFAGFLRACDDIIPPSEQELLNVTLRWVEADPVSVLAFAPQPRIAAVMLFSQAMMAQAEADMARMTEQLIAASIEVGGSFYLPYRLHARPEQVRAAYSGLDRFAEEKRRFDPDLIFRNALWDTYVAV
jgi:FAD/FMN-containing dehydrogenase